MDSARDASRNTSTASLIDDDSVASGGQRPSSPGTSDQAPDERRSPEGRRSELDRYADEFANLVQQHPPSRTDAPSGWLARLPDEVFSYYDRGIATFGHRARTPVQRRGRLYLLHTALVLLWMKWGKQGARERLEAQAQKGVRRTAYLTTLEHYRRGGVLHDYEVPDWCSQPVEEWTLVLVSGMVALKAVPDPNLQAALEGQTVVTTDMEALSALRDAGAIPRRGEITLA